jgi:hypothetical protein
VSTMTIWKTKPKISNGRLNNVARELFKNAWIEQMGISKKQKKIENSFM